MTFDNVESATRAKEELHQNVWEGRRIVVQYAANESSTRSYRPKMPASRTLFIGNMSYDLTDKDLNDLFSDVANVMDVRVAVDKRTGQPRGFAHAEFVDVESAQVAFEILSRKAPNGRKLRLDYSSSSKRAAPTWNGADTQPTESQ